MRRASEDTFRAWAISQTLLVGLLGAGLALFVTNPVLRTTWQLPAARLVLDTLVALAAILVAALAGVRFSVEGRKLDLILCAGFTVLALGTTFFSIVPVLGGNDVQPIEAWARLGCRLLGWALVAYAPWARGRVNARERAMVNALVGFALLVFAIWLFCRWMGPALPPLLSFTTVDAPPAVTSVLAIQAMVSLLAMVGFSYRFWQHGEDLDRWLALAATLALFAELHYVFTPVVSSRYVSEGDFLRLLSYGILLVGVWRAIRSAEFGRAVADERARLAREIHDGLAQYLFAISTHAAMLEGGAPPETLIPKLKEATLAAQREARFAVLALSSASGTAPFDAAIRRYVEFLTADGNLEVDLEIDPTIRLAPDEQIEVFRIVQEGLGNVRKHANATRAEVRISERNGQRLVTVTDDGQGFSGEGTPAGQGLKNIRARAAAIDGGVEVRSEMGRGTAVEVLLRA